jgi:enamine deaminase RidA (YjgF/YER057c/UK114 family)
VSAVRALEPRTRTFSAAVAADGWLHVSGQVATDAEGRVDGDCGEQAARCLQKIDALLHAAGASRADVVKLTAYLVDGRDFPLYSAAKAQWVTEPAPAGTAVIVAGLLVPGARIEIEAVARIPR